MKPYYEQGWVTIYHGDSADFLPHVGRPALLLTDPPYGLTDRSGDYGRLKGSVDFNASKGFIGGKVHPPIVGDRPDDPPFDPRPLLGIAEKTILWGGDHFAHLLPPSRGWLVWDKREELNSNMFSDAELAWTSFPTPTRMFRHKWLGYMRASEVGFHVHPAQKPVALMRWILDQWTAPGDLVFDPYMGSGPIAQACHEMGRRYVGVEIVEGYCELAVGRLAQGVLAFEA